MTMWNKGQNDGNGHWQPAAPRPLTEQEKSGLRPKPVVPPRAAAFASARPSEVQWSAHVWPSGAPKGTFSVWIGGLQFDCTADEYAAKTLAT